MRHANFDVVFDGATTLVIRDLGPWDRYPTITNDAEWVANRLRQACEVAGSYTSIAWNQ